MPALAAETGITVDVLLIQGVDKRESDGQGDRVAHHFQQLPNVVVHEFEMGKLGQQDQRGAARLLKVRDLVNVRLSQGRLLPLARDFDPHLVYGAQQVWDARIAAPLAQQLGCPQIVHLHYAVGPWLGKDALEMLRQARMVVAVSEFIRDDAIAHGVAADRVHRLYNSIAVPPPLGEPERTAIRREFRAELAVQDDALLVGMAARLTVFKGQAQLVEAMIPILLSDQRVHLVLAGDEAPGSGIAAHIIDVARDYEVAAQVHLLGYRSDVPRLLAALDLFAHPSRSEPFSLAILEAMAHGLPVVAWREGGPAEIIVDGHTGFLIESMDIDGLTRALNLLITDPSVRETMGRAGRERAATAFAPSLVSTPFLKLLGEAATTRADEGGGIE